MRAKPNWSTIGTIIQRLVTFGIIGGLSFGVYSCINQDISDDKALKDASVVTENDASYTLVDSDTVKMEKNKLIYLFNFDMRHLTIKGKVDGYNLDSTYTFDQYTDQSRIREVHERACGIARNFSAMTINDQTPSTVKKGHQSATAFAAAHCPQPRPANG